MSTTIIPRGSTIYFSTSFYDVNSHVVQPVGANLQVSYTLPGGAPGVASVEMTPPTPPATAWTAQWDSRGAFPSSVSWSIHSEGVTPPYSVEDGWFLLSANDANVSTF